MLTAEQLRECLSYNPDDGTFIRLISHTNRHKAGIAAGCSTSNGYVRIYVADKQYLAHRLAFLYMTGEFPRNLVDHINGNKSDNSWSNLREINKSGNGQNTRRAWGHNKTGVLGIGRRGKKFRARIYANGKDIHLGEFQTQDEAREKYLEAKKILHPFSGSN